MRHPHHTYHPSRLRILLAPWFCMGYFHSSTRRKISIIALTTGIALLVLLVRLLPQPWRGIIDAGVVVGLTWGMVSLATFAFHTLVCNTVLQAPDAPDETLSA